MLYDIVQKIETWEISVMIRSALQKLLQWKNAPDRKPLLLQGARQVGKTWLMKEFGRLHFSRTAYIHFDNNKRMQEIFSGDYDIARLLTAFQIEAGCTITPQDTLIVFDEVQEAPNAINSLKYFCEEAPEYPIIAAGSLLGISLHKDSSFPVGKVNFLDLYPLSFMEFLRASDNERLADLAESGDWPMITSFKSKFIELLRLYYYVGGMPEAVMTFLLHNDLKKVRDVQRELLRSYNRDFSKHAPKDAVPRIQLIWNSIPSQLARENRKFIYGALRTGARAREFEAAMGWLLGAGLIHNVFRAAKPAFPLSAYRTDAFKTYMLDVGLLGAKSGLNAKTILEGNAVFQEFKGALTEQYVQQQLRAECGISPFYWTHVGGGAEVDFLCQSEDSIIPLEVKAEENLQSKSLGVYGRIFHPPFSVRTSMADYRISSRILGGQQSTMVNLPLYAISQILRECGNTP